jgi:hypothetical protein
VAQSVPISHQVTLSGDQEAIRGRLLTQLSPALARHGLKLTGDTGTAVTWTRRYTPTWAIVCAIIGFLIVLLGLLFLLVKDTDTLVASLQPSGDKTVVTFTGSGPNQTMQTIAWFEQLSVGTPQGWYDDPESPGQQRFWDGSAWTDQRRPAQAAQAPEVDAS